MHVIVTRCGAGRSVWTWLQGVCIRAFFKATGAVFEHWDAKKIYRKRQPHVWGYKPGFLWIETAIQPIVAPAQDGCFQVKNTHVLDGGSRDAWSSYRIGKKRPELWPVESGLLILLYYGVQLPCICTYMHAYIYIHNYTHIYTYIVTYIHIYMHAFIIHRHRYTCICIYTYTGESSTNWESRSQPTGHLGFWTLLTCMGKCFPRFDVVIRSTWTVTNPYRFGL